MLEKYEEKLQAEIDKLEAETNEIKKKWHKKPDFILKLLIFLVGATSVGLFSTLYNINNERLKLERAELKRDIYEFTIDKDSLNNQINDLSKLSDSLKVNFYQLLDSLSLQRNNYIHVQDKLSKKESRIILLVQELTKIKNEQSTKKLQQRLSSLLKVEADAGPDITICIHKKAKLKASGGKTFLWSTGENTSSIVVNPKKTTTYFVKVFDGKNIDTDSVTVFFNKSCSSSISLGSDISICSGEVITLD